MKLAGQGDLKKFVESWFRAYESRDKNLVRELFSHEKEAFHYGTGKDELIYGLEGMLEQLDRDWSQSHEARLSLKGFRSQEITDMFAWIACEILPEVKIEGKWNTFPEMRCTLVLKKVENSWRVVHTHASWPYESQEEGQSFPQS